MIKKIHACNKMNFSSNINEVISAVLNSSLFFYKKISHTPKSIKSTKNSNLFTYLRFSVFCAREEKKRENKK